ncbi:MAG: DUF6141 family protein [Candidatus Aminicenantes bacterium]|jgi:hypothetical protein
MATNDVLFREVQRFRQLWIWVFVIFLMVLAWYSFIQQIVSKVPFGTRPAPDLVVIGMWILFGLIFPVMVYTAGLTTEVRGDGIHIRFIPFHRRFRTMPLEAIQSYEARTYRPLKEYGGWGIRYGAEGKAYNVSGNRGVQLFLLSGRKILLGSQHPEGLVLAIDRAKGSVHEGDQSQNR